MPGKILIHIALQLTCALAVLCVPHSAMAQSSAGLLRIGIEGEYPPFNQVSQDGNLVGFDVDIANALCGVMQVQCKFVVQSWNGIIPALLANKSDLIISSMAITEKRKEMLAFSTPYYIESAEFVAARDKPLTVSVEGLKGKVIGVQGATIFEKMLKEKFPGVTVRVYTAVSDHNLDLKSGRIDAVLGSDLVMNNWLQSPDARNFEVKGMPFIDEHYMGQGAGIAARKTDPALIARVNAALESIRRNGQYDAIVKKYFNHPLITKTP
jgi:lysine-arginine-ornithine-binding protein